MRTNIIPCKNCIILPICKNIQISQDRYIVNPVILKKCSLIREYTGFNPYTLIGIPGSNEKLVLVRRVLQNDSKTSM